MALSRHRREAIRLLDPLNHPLRRGILRRLRRSCRGRSIGALSVEMRRPLSVIAYHMTVLAQRNLVATVKGDQGAADPRYEATATEDRDPVVLLEITAAVDDDAGPQQEGRFFSPAHRPPRGSPEGWSN
jgi:DNA-binding transcriptional ArsR family regulator